MDNKILNFEKRIGVVEERIDTLGKIVLGDETLSVPSIRETVKQHNQRIEAMEQVVERAKWIAIGLTLSNAGLIASILATIFGK